MEYRVWNPSGLQLLSGVCVIQIFPLDAGGLENVRDGADTVTGVRQITASLLDLSALTGRSPGVLIEPVSLHLGFLHLTRGR